MQLIRTFRSNGEHQYHEDNDGNLHVATSITDDGSISVVDFSREMGYKPCSAPCCFVVPVQDAEEQACDMIVHFDEARWLRMRGMKVDHSALCAFNAFEDTL